MLNQRALSQLVQAWQRAWGSNTRYQSPLILIPAPSWFLSSVSLGQHSNPYFCLGFGQGNSSTSLLVLLTISTCILTCSAAELFGMLCLLSSRRVFIPSCLLAPFLLLVLCGFMSFWILFLDHFNGCSSGIRKKWVHGLPSRFKWKIPKAWGRVVVALTNAMQTWGDIHK